MYDPAEQDDLMKLFIDLLWAVTKDGASKRRAGAKVSWKVDPAHLAGIFSHMDEYFHGRLVDKDSGQHPGVHLAWRWLAIALQDMHRGEPGWAA